MTKAHFTIRGNTVHDEILTAIADFQHDEFVFQYDLKSGTVFMFEQYKRSPDNFVLNVIVDFSLETQHSDELILQCVAMAGKDRGEIQFFKLETSIMVDFRLHFFGFRERNNRDWEIGDVVYE